MKSFQNFFNEFDYYITPSEIIEFLYCKRFIYYMKCAGISQKEEQRYKVQKGRDIHKLREIQNKNYLRKSINSVNKVIDINLISNVFMIRGKVDEIHTLVNGELAPLDYKFAIYDEKIYSTYKNQLILYGIMIEEIYQKSVKKGFLVYCRNGSKLVEIEINEKDKKNIKNHIDEYKKVIKGYYPKGTKSKSKCLDCCYKNICIK
ncbi:MAG: CRISPR-associated protein Cas4 [Clostridiales bacterium]